TSGQRPRHASFDRNRQEPARRRVGRSRVHGISDQPAGGGPLSGTLRPGRRQVRSRRCGVLAHILRTDRHLHRPLPAVSEEGRAVKALARQHQEAIWALHQTVSRLRSVLLEFYPQALQAFPNLKHKAALTVLAAAPTPAAGQRLTRGRVVALLRRSGRGNHPALVEQILTDLHTPALGQPPRVEEAYGHTVRGLVAIVIAMGQAVDDLDTELAREFDQHPQAAILRSVPGLGPVLAARVLGEIGDDPARFDNPQGLRAYAGTAPVTIASGRLRYVKARKVRNKRFGDA